MSEPGAGPAAGDSFPRQHARTRRFTLGRPRSFTVAPDGSRVLFLRSRAGDDATTALWRHDVGTGTEALLFDPHEEAEGASELTPEERARRERLREMATGVTAYATDEACDTAVLAIGGAVATVDVATGSVEWEEAPPGAFDPRLSPDGGRIAVAADGGVHVLDRGGSPRVLVEEDGVSWGVADFVAAEEMGRSRGFWWSPEGDAVVACRVDESAVPVWHLSDPSTPATEPTRHRYPAAGTTNPEVTAAVLPVTGGEPVPIAWDTAAFPYLARVSWSDPGPLTLLVQSRDQRRWQVVAADPSTGTTTVVREDRAAAWLELVPGTPAWTGDGRLVMAVDVGAGDGGTRAIRVGDDVLSPPGLQVRRVVEVTDDAVWAMASEDPTVQDLYRLGLDGAAPERITSGGGWWDGAVGGGTVVVVGGGPAGPPTHEVRPSGGAGPHELRSLAETPVVAAEPRMLELGERRLRAALLLPRDAGEGSLPVVLDPYGGPHAQRAVRAPHVHLTSQWLADQGFAVLVIDGRGTPGRGPAWERAVAGDLAAPVLADQIDGLHAAAEVEGRLDLSRVAIRGWSFGGYLAALGVLRRPDVFRAAIAGAPVTDWRLYDTHYTERYLGHPDENPDAYDRSSLVDADGRLLGAVEPPGGRHPDLLLIHGMADDNVVAAHSLRLSAALLAAGRPHRFLPLSGVTHMTPQEVVAENLLHLQVAFLREALGAR